MKKEHFEILLEEMNSKFELVLEGHGVLLNKIEEVRQESNAKHEHTAFMLDALNRKIDNVDARLSARIDRLDTKVDRLDTKVDGIAADLTAHRSDTEAHRGLYRISE